MINFKQKELSQKLFEQLHQRFPEITLMNVAESSENPQDIWVMIMMPEDEDREIQLREIAGELSMDILLNFGYHITTNAAPEKAHVASKTMVMG